MRCSKIYAAERAQIRCCGEETWIYIQQISDDGRTLAGEPARLIKQDQSCEVPVVKGPDRVP